MQGTDDTKWTCYTEKAILQRKTDFADRPVGFQSTRSPRSIYASYMKAITFRSQYASEAPEVTSWKQRCLGHTSRDSDLVNQHQGQEAALLVSKRPGGTEAGVYPFSEARLQQYHIITFEVFPGYPPCQSVLILTNVRISASSIKDNTAGGVGSTEEAKCLPLFSKD